MTSTSAAPPAMDSGSGSGSGEDSALRRRTRRAIVDAAVHVWARNFSAPLAAVAEEAGVSRSTLHRYFADRPALVDECLRAADEAFGEVSDDDAAQEGSVLDRLVRDLELVLPLSNWVLFIWSDPMRFADHPIGAEFLGEEGLEPVKDLLRRGQQTGELDADAPVDWLLGLYYSVLYCAAEAVVKGQVTIAEASRLAARSLRHGIAG